MSRFRSIEWELKADTSFKSYSNLKKIFDLYSLTSVCQARPHGTHAAGSGRSGVGSAISAVGRTWGRALGIRATGRVITASYIKTSSAERINQPTDGQPPARTGALVGTLFMHTEKKNMQIILATSVKGNGLSLHYCHTKCRLTKSRNHHVLYTAYFSRNRNILH